MGLGVDVLWRVAAGFWAGWVIVEMVRGIW